MYYRLQKNVEYNNFKNIKFISESRVNTTGMVQNISEHESAIYDMTYHVKFHIVLIIKVVQNCISINSQLCLRIALVLTVNIA